MKKNFRKLAAIVVLVSSMTSVSRACVMEPITCTIVGVGLIVGMVKAITYKDTLAPMQIAQAEEQIKNIWVALDARDENFVLRSSNYMSYNPGYTTIIKRYEGKKFKALQSLANSKVTRLFSDLDLLEDVLKQVFSAELVEKTYGPKLDENGQINWTHYYLLAKDAEALAIDRFVARN